MKIKYLPRSLRFGGTRLYHGKHQPVSPQPDGIRRANEKCIELETYANISRGGSAGFIGLSILISPIMYISLTLVLGVNPERLTAMMIAIPMLPLIALIFYLGGGAHRCRGAFIRINRITRKLYFIYPGNQRHLHIIDWDAIEGVAGVIPIITPHGYTSRHPLYLFGIDTTMKPPTEICAACGNPGVIDGDRSARSLWAYLQHFMEHGLEGLPEPPQVAERRSRRDATLQPYREWASDIREEYSKPSRLLWAPVTFPIWIFMFIFKTYPDSVEAWIQYNVPYVAFPRENDVLCGFAAKRKPVIRVNGIKLDE